LRIAAERSAFRSGLLAHCFACGNDFIEALIITQIIAVELDA